MSESTSLKANNKPVRVWKAPGGLQVAVWEHVNESNGTTYHTHSIRLKKRVCDRETNKWQDTDFLRVEDLPGASWSLTRAYEWLLNRMSTNLVETEVA